MLLASALLQEHLGNGEQPNSNSAFDTVSFFLIEGTDLRVPCQQGLSACVVIVVTRTASQARFWFSPGCGHGFDVPRFRLRPRSGDQNFSIPRR